MSNSRVPEFKISTFTCMKAWFRTMARRGLLFHPDDRPKQIISNQTGQPLFSMDESRKLDAILKGMFGRFGDRVYEAAYPIFTKEFKAMTKR